jgi:hypothetical protein
MQGTSCHVVFLLSKRVLSQSMLYQFARASMTEYHTLDGASTLVYWLALLYSRSPRCQQRWFLLRDVRGSLFQVSCWFVEKHSILMPLHIIFPLCMSVCAPNFHLWKDTSHIGLGVLLLNTTSSELIASARTLFPNKSTCLGTGS